MADGCNISAATAAARLAMIQFRQEINSAFRTERPRNIPAGLRDLSLGTCTSFLRIGTRQGPCQDITPAEEVMHLSVCILALSPAILSMSLIAWHSENERCIDISQNDNIQMNSYSFIMK
jgi:hypothetical protein